jgi:GTP cyclohydrolase IV
MPVDPGCFIQRYARPERQAVSLALSRACVTHERHIISLTGGRQAELFQATLDLLADLGPDQAGQHVSRFSEVVEELAEIVRIA